MKLLKIKGRFIQIKKLCVLLTYRSIGDIITKEHYERI